MNKIKETYAANYCSLFATYKSGSGQTYRLKFVVTNGNSYWDAHVLYLSDTNGWLRLVNPGDVPNLVQIDYYSDSELRVSQGQMNIERLVKFTEELLNNF